MIDFGKDEDFIANYEKLKSSRKMGELYGCDKSSITAHAKKIGYNYSSNKERKITLIPIEQVIRDYEELQSTNKVGEKYGCSGTSVRNYLLKNGYSLTNFQAKLRDVSDEEFIKIYNELNNTAKVAKYYNCSTTTIKNKANKLGLAVKKEYKLSKEDKEEIIAAYGTHTSTELAKKYNVSRGMITKVWYDNHLLNKDFDYSRTYFDLTGQTFGYWTVLYESDKRSNNGNVYWHCRCKCGIEKDVSSASLRNGLSLSCGAHSNISKGNEKIKEILQQANIPFEIEKTFPTCKDVKEMPFDFYVNDKYLIEYDGIQHFEESIFDYEYTHKHDIMKSQWCKENNIPLIRIPYTRYNDLSLEDLKLETSSFIEK